MDDSIGKTEEFVMKTYNRFPVSFERGRGAWLWDSKGKKYLDAMAGVAVVNMGHSHPAITRAIQQEAEKLVHVSNWYYNEKQGMLAEKIIQASPGGLSRVFFCNSGAEANEAAIKLARKATGKTGIIACEGAFHGRTVGSLSLTWKKDYKGPFEPLMPGVSHVPFSDADAIRRAIGPGTAAVWLEPVQGEGGVVVPPAGYLKEVREICDSKGVLLVLDEVQTGIGRTGKAFACQHENVSPDIMCIAKALANGLPIGAVAATQEVSEAFSYGAHGSTFAGGPLVSAAALATLDSLENEKVVSNSGRMGSFLLEALKSSLSGNPAVKDIRGKGLLIGVELAKGKAMARDICAKMLVGGVLATPVSKNAIRLSPPLTITKEQAGIISGAVESALA
ncbi:MAG: acetylornithine transaminase [Candidatus Micrarchaeia archaeon]